MLRTAEGTFAYDCATQQWHELATYGATAWEAATGLNYQGAIIAGGDASGQLWQLQDGTFEDLSGPMERTFTVLVNQPMIIDNLVLKCSVGQSVPAGTIELRTSRDEGRQWSRWTPASLGLEGNSRALVRWRRLGLVDQGNMVVQVRVTDPMLSRLSYVQINAPTAGRSR